MIDQRTVEIYKREAIENGRESWWLAYAMDSNKYERAKGKTVEVGQAALETKSKRYTIFDAPGHENYIPNMIMGTAMADTAALVVSARKGEFEAGFKREGQTREHLLLAKGLDVKNIIVIINKMDEDTVQWSEDRYNEIVHEINSFLIDRLGYLRDDVVFVPISGLTGENIKTLSPQWKWYQGSTLLEILDNVELPIRNSEAPLRIPILDRIKDNKVTIFGKVESGTIKIGSKLAVLPSNKKCQVTEIYNCKNDCVLYAKPGESIQVKIRMIENEYEINKGEVLCFYNELAPISDLIEVELLILTLPKNKQIFTSGYKCIMHLHTIWEEVTIQSLLGIYLHDDNGKEYFKKNLKICKPGSKIIARISTRIPIWFEKYDSIKQLGAFILRDEGFTVGYGKILRYSSKLINKVKIADAKNNNEETKQSVNSSETYCNHNLDNRVEENKLSKDDDQKSNPNLKEFNSSIENHENRE